jgi:hypothetical protein
MTMRWVSHQRPVYSRTDPPWIILENEGTCGAGQLNRLHRSRQHSLLNPISTLRRPQPRARYWWQFAEKDELAI